MYWTAQQILRTSLYLRPTCPINVARYNTLPTAIQVISIFDILPYRTTVGVKFPYLLTCPHGFFLLALSDGRMILGTVIRKRKQQKKRLPITFLNASPIQELWLKKWSTFAAEYLQSFEVLHRARTQYQKQLPIIGPVLPFRFFCLPRKLREPPSSQSSYVLEEGLCEKIFFTGLHSSTLRNYEYSVRFARSLLILVRIIFIIVLRCPK